jgi:hypothetical protein
LSRADSFEKSHPSFFRTFVQLKNFLGRGTFESVRFSGARKEGKARSEAKIAWPKSTLRDLRSEFDSSDASPAAHQHISNRHTGD